MKKNFAPLKNFATSCTARGANFFFVYFFILGILSLFFLVLYFTRLNKNKKNKIHASMLLCKHLKKNYLMYVLKSFKYVANDICHPMNKNPYPENDNKFVVLVPFVFHRQYHHFYSLLQLATTTFF